MSGAFSFIDLAFYSVDYSTATLENYCNDRISHFVKLCIGNCIGVFFTSLM